MRTVAEGDGTGALAGLPPRIRQGCRRPPPVARRGSRSTVPEGPLPRTSGSAIAGERLNTDATRSTGSETTMPAIDPPSRATRTSPPQRWASMAKWARNGLNHGERSARSSSAILSGAMRSADGRPIT